MKQNGQPDVASLRLRALAHPLRWKLIDVISREGSATATRCAELVGESVASCWYHLGVLHKYGYVEPVPGTSGKEKPWRATPALSEDLSGDADSDDAELAAVDAFLDHQVDKAKRRLRHPDLALPEWTSTNLIAGASVYVTAEELTAIKAEFIEILNRYAQRSADTSTRPAESRPAQLFVSAGLDPTV
ncbi:MAG TPA: helix-turn-helix domain-containing protein [Micromonosporaceae bacterium]